MGSHPRDVRLEPIPIAEVKIIMTQFKPLAMLLTGTALLVLAQGLMLALVPLSMNAQGFSVQVVGLTGSAYFAGTLLGAWDGARIIRTVGYIRAYGGLVALIMATVLTMPLFPQSTSWIILRFLHGMAAGGAFLAIEAWLNAASEGAWRGRVLGLYTLISLGGLGAAQFLVNVVGVEGSGSFVIGGIIYALCIIPVMLTRIEAPIAEQSVRKSFRELYSFSPFSVVVAMMTGLGMGAYWALGAYFGARMGLTVEQVSTLMAAATFSGLLLQWPAGHLSDRMDRRRVVLVLAGVGAAASVVMLMASGAGLLIFTFALLGGMFCLYPLSMAHALDHVTRREDTLEVSRGLLLAVGLGQTLGPIVAGQFLAVFGPRGFAVYCVFIMSGIAAFTFWRIMQRAPVAPELQEKFVAVRTSTPAGTVLDPRVGE